MAKKKEQPNNEMLERAVNLLAEFFVAQIDLEEKDQHGNELWDE